MIYYSDPTIVREYTNYASFPPSLPLATPFAYDMALGILYLWDGFSYIPVGGTGYSAYWQRTGTELTPSHIGDIAVAKDFVFTNSGSVTRTSGYISSIVVGGRTLTITRNAGNYITSYTDGTRTWTYTRDANNYIASWSVA